MSTAQVEKRKCAIACTACRKTKVKCSGDRKCTNCSDYGRECVYPPPARRSRKLGHGRQASSSVGPRQAQMETILNITNTTPAPRICIPTPAKMEASVPFRTLGPSNNSGVTSRDLRLSTADRTLGMPSGPSITVLNSSPAASLKSDVSNSIIPPANIPNSHNDNGSPGSIPNSIIHHRHTDSSSMNNTYHTNKHGTSDIVPGSAPTPAATVCSDYFPSPGEVPSSITQQMTPETADTDGEECILAPQKVSCEHHGPTSWLSICSEPGIGWVCDRTKNLDFNRTARALALGWMKRLRLDTGAPRERAPDVDEETAWKLSSAYFDEAYDTVFGVVYRPSFEARLRRHYREGFPDDSSWYALRQVVYASGCRILLSQNSPTAFKEAQLQASRYFENAIAVFAELLLAPTGLVAVQALAMMSHYVEGLGSPSLEYILCAAASRLAQAKGLHRQPARAWKLPESDVLHRNWLWWAIYCREKHITRRSGRPSAIDDDEVTCQIPTKKVAGSTIDVEFFTQAIKHAQISSQVSRRLGSAKGLRCTTAELIETANSLADQLHDWYRLLPSHLKLRSDFKTLRGGPTRFECLMYIHNAYHGSLMAIHTIFTYPWVSSLFSSKSESGFRAQELASTIAMTEAARSVMWPTKYIDIDAASPHWMSFSYPILATVNLFICILKNPTSPNMVSDLAMMDMIAGHFAQMEFVTSSEMSFPFAREVSVLARNYVSRVMEMMPPNAHDRMLEEDGTVGHTNTGHQNDPQNEVESQFDFDMGDWDIFTMFTMEETSIDAFAIG